MLLIEVGEYDIYEGNYWTNRGAKAVDYFLDGKDEYPEAIICANDYMALSICEELKKRGKRVPEDVCVARFGGDEFSAVLVSHRQGRVEEFMDIFGKRLSEASRSSGKPYPIHASVGICDLKGGDTKHIFACMQMADEHMHINKRNYKKTQR